MGNHLGPAAGAPPCNNGSLVRRLHDIRVCFIVGRARSGTTLVEAMLDMNPEVSVAPECLFIMNLYGKYNGRRFSRRDLHTFCDDLWLEERFATWNLDKEDLRANLLSLPDGSTFAEVCEAVLLSYALDQGKSAAKVVSDKNHHNSLFIPQLAAAFPGAKFLHVVRDYRDNVVSHTKVTFEANDAAALAYRWKQYNAAILRTAPADRYLLLRYEDLVTDPEPQLDRVCRFLDVDFHPDMLAHHKRYRPTFSDPWQPNLKKPVNAQRVEAWRSEMRPADVVKCDAICSDIAKRLGYASSPPASLPIGAIPGIVYGWTRTVAEKLIFSLPLRVRSSLIALSRAINKSGPQI